jgi:hypothetical protein
MVTVYVVVETGFTTSGLPLKPVLQLYVDPPAPVRVTVAPEHTTPSLALLGPELSLTDRFKSGFEMNL